MTFTLPSAYSLSGSVKHALASGQPVVALESTVITHGLPYPRNLQLAQDMESEILAQGAFPATIAVIDGVIRVGLDACQLETLASDPQARKISTRDFASAVAHKANGGTTVAGTLVAAQAAGLRVFATGGIGGVHRGAPFDVSTDLEQLACTPLVVVCAGAKAILDLPATLERLETHGVPVIGYQTDEFPAFYSVNSGLGVSARADTPGEVGRIARIHWSLGLRSAVLVVQPPPVEAALAAEVVEVAIRQALEEAEAGQVRGQAVTPFLLRRVSELTHGESLQTNLALLRNNARLAARVAKEMG